MSLEIIYGNPGPRTGWDPITHMVRMAGRLLETTPITRSRRDLEISIARRLLGVLPRRRRSNRPACLLICPTAAYLWTLLTVPGWRRRYGRVLAWVIDSHWVEWLPRLIRRASPIDAFFVTSIEDVDPWRRATRRPCQWLPWGSDVLALGSANPSRPVDLQRLGRQPPAWEHDAETARACAAAGLHFAGRPPGLEDETDNETMLMRRLAQAKYTLCFSARLNPGPQTHPTRDYITGRWVDALSAGSCVAGSHPQTETVAELLWPEGLLELDPTDRDGSLRALTRSVATWDPARARLNHLRALERLDWRRRIEVLARETGGTYPLLDQELRRLREATIARAFFAPAAQRSAQGYPTIRS